MLYRVIMLLLTASLILTSCDDDGDSKKPEVYHGIVVSVTGDDLYYYERCGPDYSPVFSANVHIEDTLGNPSSNLAVEVYRSYSGLTFVPIDTNIFVTDSVGNIELLFSCQCTGAFSFAVVAAEDTANFDFSIYQDEGIFGTHMDPQGDTLFSRPALLDSIEIRARISYDWGLPAPTDSCKFTASAGYIDTTYRAFGNEGFSTISVYWYPADETAYGQIVVYALTKTYCGNWPDDVYESFRHDTASFIHAPAP